MFKCITKNEEDDYRKKWHFSRILTSREVRLRKVFQEQTSARTEHLRNGQESSRVGCVFRETRAKAPSTPQGADLVLARCQNAGSHTEGRLNRDTLGTPGWPSPSSGGERWSVASLSSPPRPTKSLFHW